MKFALVALAARAAVAQWFYSSEEDVAPVNRFLYFRTTFPTVQDHDLQIRIAADSNAALFVNGEALMRKVTRFNYSSVRAEVVTIPLSLLNDPGSDNTIVVRHHNWGDITCFQRVGQERAGLYVSWANGTALTDEWRWSLAPQYLAHEEQIVGADGSTHRIRFPQVVDAVQDTKAKAIFEPDFDDSSWSLATPIDDGPWPEVPENVETGGQAGQIVRPSGVLAAGSLDGVDFAQVAAVSPSNISSSIMGAVYHNDGDLTATFAASLAGDQGEISMSLGASSSFVTFDFHKPVHGYPRLEFCVEGGGATEDLLIDLGFGEKPFDLYTGDMYINASSGWINTEGVVGHGYADRVSFTSSSTSACDSAADFRVVELPDERTARWWVLNIHRQTNDNTTAQLHLRPRWQSWTYRLPATAATIDLGGDPELAIITNLSMAFALISMSDTYVDTPGREDGQWLEDARPRAVLAARWFNDSALRRLLVRQPAEWIVSHSSGSVHPFPPSNYPAGASFDWSVQWVAAMWDDFQWRGSKDEIQLWWPALNRYWSTALSYLNDQNLWVDASVLADIRTSATCPAGNKCVSGVVMPWMIRRLRMSAVMADAVNESDTATSWRDTAEAMAEAFRKFVLVPADDAGVPAYVPDVCAVVNASVCLPMGVSQAAQTEAVVAGLLTRDEAAAVLDYVFPGPRGDPPPGVSRWNNPTFLYRSLKALTMAGRHEVALEHLRERFSQYLPGNPANPVDPVLQGPIGGPLPEYWISRIDQNLSDGQICHPQPTDGTGSHGWTSVGLLWMHDSLLGVEEPGAFCGGFVQDQSDATPERYAYACGDTPAHLQVAPEDAGLHFLSGTTFTSIGQVSLDWRPANSSAWRLLLTVPEAEPATYVDIWIPERCILSDSSWTVEILPDSASVVARGLSYITIQGHGALSLTCG